MTTHAPAETAGLDLRAIERITRSESGDPLHVGGGAVSERYRLLAHRVQQAGIAKPARTLLVTSATPGDGKSTVAANLAGVLAGYGRRVLLLDGDLRACGLSRILGLPSSLPGLGEVLSGGLLPERALRLITSLDLYFLSAGKRLADPVPFLEGAALKQLFGTARGAFDWIIVDSPPLGPVADTHYLASVADLILLVVRWGLTPRAELDQALKMLDGLPLMGIVLNAFDEPQRNAYASYYSRSAPAPTHQSTPTPDGGCGPTIAPNPEVKL